MTPYSLHPVKSHNAGQSQHPCAFCSNSAIRDRAIADDGLAWAFPTNIPITPGHTLITPRRCVQRLSDLTADERLAVLGLADRIMQALKLTFGAEGFNCVWNQEKLAGQTVPHFHLHVIPRKEGDSGLLGYDPRSMLYRTGDREPTGERDILLLRDEIKRNLSLAVVTRPIGAPTGG